MCRGRVIFMAMSDYFSSGRKTWRDIVIVLLLFATLTPASLASSFSLEDEIKVGEEFYQRILRSGVLIQNDRLTRYLDNVGGRLLAAGPRVPFNFRFLLLQSNAVNAFATPGGYIYVNLGLVSLAENEAMLASVLAHEIAHVNSRHIASMIKKSQTVNAATLAAIIAGALLGGGGDLTAAVASFSLAAGSMMQLKYSREHEEESDRIGMATLSSAGYATGAALDFLRNMRKNEFFSSNLPSYFFTHPGIDDRIRYIESLIATSYPSVGKNEITGNFLRFKTLITLEGRDNLKNLRHFTTNLNNNPNSVDDLYGLAVTQERLGLLNEALNNFQKALSQSPDDQDILRDMSISLLNAGRHHEAIPFLNRSLLIDSENPQTITYLGRAYLSAGDYQRALDILERGLKIEFTKDAAFYLLLGTAYGRQNKQGESHFYFAHSFKLNDRINTSIHHFQEALRHLPKNSPLNIEAQRELEALRDAGKSKKREAGKR